MSRPSKNSPDDSTNRPSVSAGGPAGPGPLTPAAAVPGQLSRPIGAVIIAVLVALESLALLAVAIWYVIELLTSAPQSLGGAIFMVVLLLALTAGMSTVAWKEYQGFRWTRSPAFVWQLLLLTIAVPTLLSGAIVIGIVLLVPPVVVLLLLFTPKVLAFTQRTGGANPVL